MRWENVPGQSLLIYLFSRDSLHVFDFQALIKMV